MMQRILMDSPSLEQFHDLADEAENSGSFDYKEFKKAFYLKPPTHFMKKHFQIISPVDGSVYKEGKTANAKAIEKTLAKAKAARRAWKATPIQDRIASCQKALDYFLKNSDAIAAEITWQMGRPIRYTPYEITKGFKERAEFMMAIAERSLADIGVGETAGFQRFIRRDPIGIVLVLAPWNYPYLTSVNAIFPALLAGNTVVLKHSNQTPLCAERYAAAFGEAGLPEGVFQYLHISHKQVAKVIKDDRVSYVAFTGSVAGGQAVQKAIGKRFISAGLELGGKDPAYVRADADLESAIENLVDGSFFQFWPVLLRHRADLCGQKTLQAVFGRIC